MFNAWLYLLRVIYVKDQNQVDFFFTYASLEFLRGSSGAITKGMQADEFQFVADPE
jgi:hypothetical protein